MAKDPAFLFYSKDWLSGTAEMLPEEKGVYIDLLAYQHQNNTLPNDTKRLAMLVRLSEGDFIKIWEILKPHFEPNGDRLVNKKLTEVMTERYQKAKKNKIVGIFASLLRKENLSKKDQIFIKSEFKIEDYTNLDTECITERLTEWFNKCLKSIGDANGNIKEYNKDIIELNEKCKKYFDEKYINEKSLDCFDKLVRLDGYSIKQIKTSILNARSEEFWNKNFLTPVKLRDKDDNGVLYIDRFLAIKPKKEEEKKVYIPPKIEKPWLKETKI